MFYTLEYQIRSVDIDARIILVTSHRIHEWYAHEYSL